MRAWLGRTPGNPPSPEAVKCQKRSGPTPGDIAGCVKYACWRSEVLRGHEPLGCRWCGDGSSSANDAHARGGSRFARDIARFLRAICPARDTADSARPSEACSGHGARALG